jgi:hypothetical protein
MARGRQEGIARVSDIIMGRFALRDELAGRWPKFSKYSILILGYMLAFSALVGVLRSLQIDTYLEGERNLFPIVTVSVIVFSYTSFLCVMLLRR